MNKIRGEGFELGGDKSKIEIGAPTEWFDLPVDQFKAKLDGLSVTSEANKQMVKGLIAEAAKMMNFTHPVQLTDVSQENKAYLGGRREKWKPYAEALKPYAKIFDIKIEPFSGLPKE